jgi:hypothetical protein
MWSINHYSGPETDDDSQKYKKSYHIVGESIGTMHKNASSIRH